MVRDDHIFSQSWLENILSRDEKMFQISSKNWVAIPRWSGSPISYILMATWVSQRMKAEKRATEMQLLDFIIISENMLGPMKNAAPKPHNCKPIRPNRLPISTLPYLSIESFGMLQAAREAPPKMAAVRPRQVGTIVGLTALAQANKGAPPKPSPKTPMPNIACRIKLLTDLIVYIFSLSLSCSVSTWYCGLMYEVATKPTIDAMAPPMESGIIMAESAGTESTAQEVASAPPNASPV